MEGFLYTCSLMFFLLISCAVNASHGVFFEEFDLFQFSLSNDRENAPSPSPESLLMSPSYSPEGSPKHPNGQSHRGTPKQPSTNEISLSNTVKKGPNNGKMAGYVLASIAGGLQVVVVTYLLVKRRQMLRVVEKYEV